MLKDLADYELIKLIRKGDKLAEETFFQRYKIKSEMLGKSLYYQYKKTGIQTDEFIQVALISVSKALRLFDNNVKNFEKYWSKIVQNEVADYIKTDHSIFSSGQTQTSLDDFKYQEEEKLQFHEVLCEPKTNDDFESLSSVLEAFIYSKHNGFNDDEALAAHLLFYRTLTTMEIAEFTGWKKAKAFYVVRSVRKKISDYLKSGYFK